MLEVMQLAERWLGIGSMAVAVGLVAGFALRPHHRHHHHVTVEPRISFDRTNCTGIAAPAAQAMSVDRQLLTQQRDPYEDVFHQANVAPCFTHSDRVEMLIDIAPDGHVTRATHRPEPSTRESRCISDAVRGLQFPATGESIAIRYAFTR